MKHKYENYHLFSLQSPIVALEYSTILDYLERDIMQKITFNNGITAPIFGFGTYRINPLSTSHYVQIAIKTGYRLFDTAQYYRNEAGVGKAINNSQLPREEFFLTTMARTSGYKATKKSIDKSLITAHQDYFDLMLVHFPMPDYLGTYQALEEAYKEGKLRSIGVSNFDNQEIQNVIDNFETVPAVNQIETNVYVQDKPIKKFMDKHGIIQEAYAPLGEGPNPMFHDPYLHELAKKYNKSVAQIMLKFLVQSGLMTIPGSTNPAHIKENIDIFDFEFTDDEMNHLRSLDQGTSNWLGYQG